MSRIQANSGKASPPTIGTFSNISTPNGLDITSNVLTLHKADGTNSGGLSFTDWNTFNNKQSALTFGNLTDSGIDGIIITSGTGAVIGSGTSISQHVSDSTHNGYLSSTDWNIFNSKQNALTFGSISTSTSGVLIVNGSNSTVGPNVTVNIQTANGSQSGLLSSSDWSTFNNKQPAGNYITALNGDATATGPGSVTLTLSTVNSNVGTFGSSTSIPTFTVNGKGLITSASGNVVIAPAGTLTGTTLASNVVFSSLTTLGVLSSNLDMGNHLINNVNDPVSGQDAATKNYVDTGLAALNPATSVYAATTTNIPGTYLNGIAGIGATFTTTATGVFTVDGVTPPLNSRILIKNQTSGFQNGIYDLTTLGSIGIPAVFTRSFDYDTPSDMNVAGLIPVKNGTVNALSSWQQIAVITTVGTDALVFMEFTANPSLYLLKANNLSDVSNSTISFNNISPMTTGGDIIYGGASGTGLRLSNGSTNQVLTSSGGTSAPTWSFVSAANLIGTTLASNVVNSSLTTVGTITTGTWNGTTIAVMNGGTGLSTTPTDGQLLIGKTSTSNYALNTLTAGNGISITNGSGSITIASINSTTTKTANYTILSTDSIIFCDTSGGAFTLTLPNPSTLAGKIFRIIDTTGSFQTNNLTLSPFGSEKIEGLAASKILQTAWGWFNVTTNGTDWYCG